MPAGPSTDTSAPIGSSYDDFSDRLSVPRRVVPRFAALSDPADKRTDSAEDAAVAGQDDAEADWHVNSPRYLEDIERLYSVISSSTHPSADDDHTAKEAHGKHPTIAKLDASASASHTSTSSSTDTVHVRSKHTHVPSSSTASEAAPVSAAVVWQPRWSGSQVAGAVLAVIIAMLMLVVWTRPVKTRRLLQCCILVGGLLLLRWWQRFRLRRAASLSTLQQPGYAVRFRGAGFLWPYYMGAMDALMPHLPPPVPAGTDLSTVPLANRVYYQGSSAGSFAAIAAACGPTHHLLSLLFTWHHQQQAVEKDAAKGNTAASRLLEYLQHGFEREDSPVPVEDASAARVQSDISLGVASSTDLSSDSASIADLKSEGIMSPSSRMRRKAVTRTRRQSVGMSVRMNVGHGVLQASDSFSDLSQAQGPCDSVPLSRDSSFAPVNSVRCTSEDAHDHQNGACVKNSETQSHKHDQKHGRRPRSLSVSLSSLYHATDAPTWLEIHHRIDELCRILPASRLIMMDVMKTMPLEHFNHRLCIVAWDCLSWQAVYRNTWTSYDQICNWAIASCRIPFVTGMPMWIEGMFLCDVWGRDDQIPLPGSKMSVRISALSTSDAEAEVHPSPKKAFSFLDAAGHLTPWREVYVKERGRLDATAYLHKHFGQQTVAAVSRQTSIQIPAESPCDDHTVSVQTPLEPSATASHAHLKRQQRQYAVNCHPAQPMRRMVSSLDSATIQATM